MSRFFSRVILALFFTCILFSCKSTLSESGRTELLFTNDWLFLKGDGEFADIKYDDQNWRKLSLPHDWSIEGKFSNTHPATVGGGALPGGVGWYRKHFRLQDSDSLLKTDIHFDGVYMNSDVYINGHHLGNRPNGYISFRYDLTPYLKFANEENILAVRVDNSQQPNSRWYSGSGIYRNVYLVKTAKVYLDYQGSYIRFLHSDDGSATMLLDLQVRNESGQAVSRNVRIRLYDPEGKKISMLSESVDLEPGNLMLEGRVLQVPSPELWSPHDPKLYTCVIDILDGKTVIDQHIEKTGLRYFSFKEDGFSLNGKAMKILGVCMHHDLGCLGAAVNRSAIERQLKILKEMGCNAIRTAHNPPAPELLNLCDEMGFLVMNETFDMWKLKKSPYDYSLYWDEWHARDLRDHILRDRNHPSVIMWSIGNEILEQWDSSGTLMAIELSDIVRSVDTTRPLLTGNNWPKPENTILKAGVLDLVGYNYQHKVYESFPIDFPGKCFIATETTSALMTRGHYDMPSDSIRRWPVRWDIPFNDGNPDNTVSAYDNVSTPWGSTHEESWKIIKAHDYLSGMFIWTGFDYLGEPTPYGWPSRSSYFGIIDLAGFPKDVYYMYKSEWTTEPVLHVFPHWNWEAGEKIDVLAYTNCSSVELFLNDVSQGVRINNDTVFHLSWSLEFQVGTLKAVGILPGGDSLVQVVRTAGNANELKLLPDRSVIRKGSSDFAFIEVNVVDKDGVLVPDASELVEFSIEGDAEIVAVDNGSQTSHEAFKAKKIHAFKGKCLVLVKAGRTSGPVSIIASAPGLKEGKVELDIK